VAAFVSVAIISAAAGPLSRAQPLQPRVGLGGTERLGALVPALGLGRIGQDVAKSLHGVQKSIVLLPRLRGSAPW